MNQKNDVMDKIIDNLITTATSTAIKQMPEDISVPEEELIFSKEYESKINKLLFRERRKVRSKKLSKILIHVAAAFLIFTTVATVAIYNVEAWRIRFRNFIVDIRQQYTIIDFNEEFVGDTFRTDELYLGYIPYEFQLEESSMSENYLFVLFMKDSMFFSITVNDINHIMAVDTEDASVRRIQINGLDAMYSTNENINILVWHDNEYSYRISGNLDEETIIKIAENLQRY